MNKEANVSVIETMMNRAAMAGTSLAAQATLHSSEGGYYAGYNPGALATRRAFLEDSLNKALGGSNVSNYATGPLGTPPIGPQTSNTHINPQLTQTTHVNMYGVGDGQS